MNEDRIPQVLQAIATLIAISVIVGTLVTVSRKFGGTIPGMVARMLKWAARWLTNLATQYDVFLKNWRAYVVKNPIIMQCEQKGEQKASTDYTTFVVTKVSKRA